MAGDRSNLDERVYMVNAEDEHGDHHVFVTNDLARAEARHATILDQFRPVKANWLEDWGQ